MKFISLYLKNYIGIYNGMGLNEIFIDFSKCKHRTTIIRGDNGSGKSTIKNALHVLPDPNESFIPSLAAVKEIYMEDNGLVYRFLFNHGMKPNGDRDTTKAYISKIINGQPFELNENGNVTSFREVLFNELRLDANFIALSQLSSDDRGLADKKPGERKRFVVSILESLEVYNAIHKTLTKRSSNYKSMISSIVSKLGNIGDEDNIRATLQSIKNRLDRLENEKESISEQIGIHKSKINSADPNGSIQNNYSLVESEHSTLKSEDSKLDSMIGALMKKHHVGFISQDACERFLSKLSVEKNDLDVELQILKNNVSTALANREAESEQLQKKTIRLNSLDNSIVYEDLIDRLTIATAEKEEIECMLLSAGVDITIVLSKEEYILALETLKDIKDTIDVFRESAELNIIEESINLYLNGKEYPDTSFLEHRAIEANERKNEILESIKVLDDLWKRTESARTFKPKDCNNPKCGFIAESLKIWEEHPDIEKELEDISKELASAHLNVLTTTAEYQRAVKIVECMNYINVIVRSIDRNGSILSKIPYTKQYADKISLFKRFLNGDTFNDINLIYSQIQFANALEEYRLLKQSIDSLNNDLAVFDSKIGIIDEIAQDIDSIKIKLNDIGSSIDMLNSRMTDISIRMMQLQDLELVYRALLDKLVERHTLGTKIAENEKQRALISINMGSIQQSILMIEQLTARRLEISREIVPIQRERDFHNHSLAQISEYKNELESLNREYDFIETIKFYSSPTTGIQLVFMQLYMGKIIELANELLGLLFNGKFLIQPFVINESEFRIPCMGNGYMNDDISSMSNAQISMISMILSFAFLHHSSTKFNIIKLDEIDGALDETNRIMFIDVLNRIMDIMHTEQCIIISHNTELQVDASDVILLRMDNSFSNDYVRGNVIWKYS